MIGAHAVGVPDGGPGLPVTRWSTDGGTCASPTSSASMRFSSCRSSAGGWDAVAETAPPPPPRRPADRDRGRRLFGLAVTTLVEALRGLPLLSPDGLTVALGLALLGGGAMAAAIALSWPRATPARRPLVDPLADLLPQDGQADGAAAEQDVVKRPQVEARTQALLRVGA